MALIRMAGMPRQPGLAPMGLREWVVLLLLGGVWGSSFVFVDIALEAWPPLSVVCLRLSGGAAVLWGLAWITKSALPRDYRAWAAMAVMGLLNNLLPFALFAWGQTQIASGLAAILNATTPLFTAALAGVFLPDERIGPAKVCGIAFGLAGVVVMIAPDLIAQGADAKLLAIMCGLGAACSYAVAAIFGRRFVRFGVSPIVAAAGQVSAGAVILAGVLGAIGQPLEFDRGGLVHWGAIAGLVFLSTGLAYCLYFHLLAKTGATNLSLVTILIPVFAILLGAIFLGQGLAVEHGIGLAVIMLALVIIDGRATAMLAAAYGPDRRLQRRAHMKARRRRLP